MSDLRLYGLTLRRVVLVLAADEDDAFGIAEKALNIDPNDLEREEVTECSDEMVTNEITPRVAKLRPLAAGEHNTRTVARLIADGALTFSHGEPENGGPT